MSTTDDKKKYITLEGVRVSYKAKDDTLHITSTDDDVQAGGFHLALTRGTQTEVTLRELMIEAGVIRVVDNTASSVFTKVEKSPHRNIIAVTGLIAPTGVGKSMTALLLAKALGNTRSRVDGHWLNVAVINIGDDSPKYFAADVAIGRPFLERPFRAVTRFGSNHPVEWSDKLGIFAASLPPLRPHASNFDNFGKYADKINAIAGKMDIVILDTSSEASNPERDEIALPLANFVLHVIGTHGEVEVEQWVNKVTTGENKIGRDDIDFVYNGGITELNNGSVPTFPFDTITSLPRVDLPLPETGSVLTGVDKIMGLEKESPYMSEAINTLAEFYGKRILAEVYA